MNKTHVDLAREFGYDPSLIAILEECDEKEFQTAFPKVYANLKSCQTAKDNRTLMEYAKDLVENWLFEDTIVNGLKKKGIDIRLSGADKEREILGEWKVTQEPDTIIGFRGKSIYMEIIRNNTNYWSRNDAITSLRGKKLQHLVEDKALCLCVKTKYPKEYAIIDFSKDIKIKESYVNEGIGGKVQTPIPLSENGIKFNSFSFTKLASDITSILISKKW